MLRQLPVTLVQITCPRLQGARSAHPGFPGPAAACRSSHALRVRPADQGRTAPRSDRRLAGAFFADPGVRRDCVKVTRGIVPTALLEPARRLASFDRPTLLAFAREDRLFPYAHGERLAAIVPGAQLETIPDSRTWVMRDQPDLTALLISEFIRNTPTGATPADATPA